jgi:predicted  nucleic acid-binding Zn-ribbon protein
MKDDSLAREFDACGEVRIEIGGPKKYRILTIDEIIMVVNALEGADTRAEKLQDEMLHLVDAMLVVRQQREELIEVVQKLRERVTELEVQLGGQASRDEEVRTLKEVPMKYKRMEFNAQLHNRIAELEAQLAALSSRTERRMK